MSRTMRVAFVGAGWRLAPYLTVLRALPDEFEPVAAVSRTERTAERFQAEHGVPTGTDLDRLLAAGGIDFAVLSVPWPQILPLAGRLLDSGVPVLSETPIAERTDLVEGFLRRFGAAAPLQSAEQYRFQPMHAARIAVARGGRLGEPVSVTASFAHDYHAMSVARAALSIGFEPVRVSATALGDRGVRPLGRDGWAERLEVAPFDRTVAQLLWPERERSVVYDFSGEQYFSPVRSRRMLVRGTLGELAEDRLVAMRAPAEPMTLPLVRTDTGLDGDLGGHDLRDVRLGDEVLWRNPFDGARLSDDEIAVATVLRRMRDFVLDGIPFYGIADAAEDQYLSELVQRAAAEERVVTSSPQAWSSLPSRLV
jgi:Oxidoreductase family, NAD-binding Rossmann fold